MSIITFIVLCLATWRVAEMFVNESGPFDIFLRIRKLAGIQHGEDKTPEIIPDKFFPNLLSCVWCFSIYVAIFWVVMWLIFGCFVLYIALVFALSAAACLFSKFVDK